MMNLLDSARFYSWVHADYENEDPSCREAIEKAVHAFASIGITVTPTSEYFANIESMLRSGLSPSEWRARATSDAPA